MRSTAPTRAPRPRRGCPSRTVSIAKSTFAPALLGHRLGVGGGVVDRSCARVFSAFAADRVAAPIVVPGAMAATWAAERDQRAGRGGSCSLRGHVDDDRHRAARNAGRCRASRCPVRRACRAAR